jgi:hypothetical protein
MQKKLTHQNTKTNKLRKINKKIRGLTKLRLVYPKNASFIIVFYLSRSHKAQNKEHAQKIKHFPLYFWFVEITLGT